MAKALVLFSGGLDSMLAALVLKEQGTEVTALCFASNFFGAAQAEMAAKEIGVPLKIVDIGEKILALVKNPPNGYGKNLNPCLDCHALMISQAGAIMKEEGFDLVATGEVLGQRPFSQNKQALDRVMKLAGLEILRPLSAKLLPETQIEKQGMVKRFKLLGISGRTREAQFELAKKYGIKNIPSPAGGCLLTDPNFSERLLKLLDNWPECTVADVEILKHSRQYWLAVKTNEKISKVLLAIGRDESDNNGLVRLAQGGDYLLELRDENGPTTLIRAKDARTEPVPPARTIAVPTGIKLSELDLTTPKTWPAAIESAARLTGYYSPKARGKMVEVSLGRVN